RVEVLEGPDQGRVIETEAELLSVGTAVGNALKLSDDTVSRFHLELSRRADGVYVEDLSSSNGTLLGSARIERGVIQPGSELVLGRTRLVVGEGAESSVELFEGGELDDLKGQTEVMRRLMAQVTTAARSNAPALVIGESGTGKELVARALHDHGPRANGPFVTLDCGALAPNLVASELFGHERGAFTSAERQHIGAFERADKGTLFLDEIGELPAELQPQLLGALERRRFRRVGGRSDVSVDVRIVAATNRDLRAEVNSGTFRLDLYYRIAVVVLRLPALRERTGDIPILVRHFLRECGYEGELERLISDAKLAELALHRWPGNVRELRNWVEATVAMGESPELAPAVTLPPEAGELNDQWLDRSYKDARRLVLEDFERRYLKHILEATTGNVAQAARKAQMDRTYLIKLIQRHAMRRR
ncbi:MAG TPA: sigma 54-interacting transcriptional regulator, partial [Polyangiaceae bacterium]|nr:sigma 54-interacting transcriptional regulator [Polyangiaceae bacterium]